MTHDPPPSGTLPPLSLDFAALSQALATQKRAREEREAHRQRELELAAQRAKEEGHTMAAAVLEKLPAALVQAENASDVAIKLIPLGEPHWRPDGDPATRQACTLLNDFFGFRYSARSEVVPQYGWQFDAPRQAFAISVPLLLMLIETKAAAPKEQP